jgi:hypothetical protein
LASGFVLMVDPPPMRVTVKGWFVNRDLSYAEAEAYHLRAAAKLAGDMRPEAIERQAEHLHQARLNRANVHRVFPRLGPDKGGSNPEPSQIRSRPPGPHGPPPNQGSGGKPPTGARCFIVVRPGTPKGGLNDPPTATPFPPAF